MDDVQRSLNDIAFEKTVGSRRPDELSTSMTFLRDGTEGDWMVLLEKSGTICFSNEKFSRGCLYGRLVSVPIIR